MSSSRFDGRTRRDQKATQSRGVYRSSLVALALVLGVLAAAWFLADDVDGQRVVGRYSERRLLILIGASYVMCWTAYLVTGRAALRTKIVHAALSTFSALLAVALVELPAVAGWIDYRRLLSPPESVIFTRLKPWERPSSRFDPELLFVHRPGLRFTGRTPGDLVDWLRIRTDRQYDVDLQYDEHGFRNRLTLTRADVVAIGDSFVEAGLVPDRDLLTSRLAAAFGVEIANLGQGGYGPQQELIVLRRYGKPLRPRLVLWFVFEGNDLGDVHRYEQFRRDLQVRRTASLVDRLFTVSALRTLQWVVAPDATRDSTEARRRSCRFDARAEDTALVDPLNLYFAYAGAELTEDDLRALDVLQRSVQMAATEVRSEGAAFLLLFVPTKYRVHAGVCTPPADGYLSEWRINDLPARLGAWAQSAGVDYLDLTGPLRAAAERGLLTYFPDDGHWNSAGHRVVAASIETRLRRRGSLNGAADRAAR